MRRGDCRLGAAHPHESTAGGGETGSSAKFSQRAPARTHRASRSRSAGRRRRSAVPPMLSSCRTWVRKLRRPSDGTGNLQRGLQGHTWRRSRRPPWPRRQKDRGRVEIGTSMAPSRPAAALPRCAARSRCGFRFHQKHCGRCGSVAGHRQRCEPQKRGREVEHMCCAVLLNNDLFRSTFGLAVETTLPRSADPTPFGGDFANVPQSAHRGVRGDRPLGRYPCQDLWRSSSSKAASRSLES